MRARPIWRTRHGGSATRMARASAASIFALPDGRVVCALCLLLFALAVPARALAAPQPQPAPSGSSSTPSPDPSPGATSSGSANSSSSSVNASTDHSVVTSSAPSEQPAETADAVAQSSGGGVSLAKPVNTRPSTPAPRPNGSTASNVPVRSVPLEQAPSKQRHLARRAAVRAKTAAPDHSLWRHMHAVWTLPASLRALLPLPHRSGLLLLAGALALFLLVGASASLMRVLMRMDVSSADTR
jgi:hypothetical protein